MPSCRIVASLGVLLSAALFSPLGAVAQRPVISSCSASPSTLTAGGTATVHVQAKSVSGQPLQYIFTASAGTVQGDGASATYTADGSAAGTVTVMCEARDGQSWVRSRTWIKVMGSASAATSAPKPATPKPATPKPTPAPAVIRATPPPVVAKPTPPPVVAKATPPPVVAKATPAPVVTHTVAPPPVVAKSTPQPTVAKPTPAPVVAAPTQARTSTPTPVITPAPAPQTTVATAAPIPAVPAPAPAKSNAETAQPLPETAATGSGAERSSDGLIEYRVPQKMIAGAVSKVVVKIHGHQDKQGAAADATRTGSLRTSQYMKVLLLAEDPGELKVVSPENADIQYVPEKGSATWTWSVIPAGAAKNQKLQVRVYQEYRADAEQDVDGESYTVTVTAPSAWDRVKKTYIEDPDAWWKYWLPAGTAFLVLLWLLWRLVDRRMESTSGPAQHLRNERDWI